MRIRSGWRFEVFQENSPEELQKSLNAWFLSMQEEREGFEVIAKIQYSSFYDSDIHADFCTWHSALVVWKSVPVGSGILKNYD